MVKRTAYQNGYEDAQDRGRFASGLPKHTDIDDYNRGFREGEAALKANTPSPSTYTRCPDHAAELARVEGERDNALEAARVAIEQMDRWRLVAQAGATMQTQTLTENNLIRQENTLLRAECEAVREFEAIDRDAYAPAQTAQEVAAWAGRHRVAKLKMTQARAATDAAGILKGAGT